MSHRSVSATARCACARVWSGRTSWPYGVVLSAPSASASDGLAASSRAPAAPRRRLFMARARTVPATHPAVMRRRPPSPPADVHLPAQHLVHHAGDEVGEPVVGACGDLVGLAVGGSAGGRRFPLGVAEHGRGRLGPLRLGVPSSRIDEGARSGRGGFRALRGVRRRGGADPRGLLLVAARSSKTGRSSRSRSAPRSAGTPRALLPPVCRRGGTWPGGRGPRTRLSSSETSALRPPSPCAGHRADDRKPRLLGPWSLLRLREPVPEPVPRPTPDLSRPGPRRRPPRDPGRRAAWAR